VMRGSEVLDLTGPTHQLGTALARTQSFALATLSSFPSSFFRFVVLVFNDTSVLRSRLAP
jgi:hypothetical protein